MNEIRQLINIVNLCLLPLRLTMRVLMFFLR